MDKRTNNNRPRPVIENIDQSRRRLTQMAWTTPVIAAITLPAHAQTSATTTAPTTTTTAPLNLTCTKTSDQTQIIIGGNMNITNILTTVNPPTSGVGVRCVVTSDDPNHPNIMPTKVSTTDVNGIADFGSFTAPSTIAVNTIITLTTSLDTITDTSGASLAPCTHTVQVVTLN